MSPALDACPGVLTLHPARDGLVARIRLPGGYASARHWRALAGLSRDFGDGCVDLTARGNVQLRGLRAADADSLAARAAAAGLLPSAEHDRARNLTASPLSGLGARPPLRALVAALDAALLAAPEFAALPGRFLFALDDGTGNASLSASDLALSYATTPASARPAPASARPAGSTPAIAAVSPASGAPAECGPAERGPASATPASAGLAGGGFDLFVAGRHIGVRVPAAEAVAAVLTATRAALAAGVGASVTRIAALPDGGQSVAAAIGGTLGAAAAPDTRLPLGPAPSPTPVRPAPPAEALPAGPVRPTSPSSNPSTSPTAIPLAGSGGLHDRDRFSPVFSGKSVTIMEESHPRGAGGLGGAAVVGARLGRLTAEQIEVIAGLVAPGEVVRIGLAGRLVIPLGAHLSSETQFGDSAADGVRRGGAAPADTGSAAIGSATTGLSGGGLSGVGSVGGSPVGGGVSGGGLAGGGLAGGGLIGAALARLGAAGLIVTAEDPVGDVTACSGAACERSLADVRAAAGPVSDYPRTHWAGCSRRCGCPPDAEPVVALGATRYRVGDRELSGEGGA